MNITNKIKGLMKEHLNASQKQNVKRYLPKYFAKFYRKNLSKLAVLFGTDKNEGHYYTQHYQNHFNKLRNRKLKVLEIGIGGYDDPKSGGESLRMWKTFFPKSQIFGIDIHDKSFHNEKRIKTFCGSQVDTDFLQNVIQEIGVPDIIIDDGSHYSEHVIETFKFLFPRLSSSGIYVIEDTQTSYWEDKGGSTDLNSPHTSMNFFKPLIDGLNYEEFKIADFSPSYYDKNIVGMHFYHNLIFIQKGANNEGSNVVSNHKEKVENL